DAKKALKIAGDDKRLAMDAILFRASLLSQMASKPTDKKLREAEAELRQGLALDPSQYLAHFDLGVILLRQERDSEGIAGLNACLSSPGGDKSTVADARRFIASPIRAREPFAPDFSIRTRENETLTNASLRGKVVLLDFWGTWCPPCRESVPMLIDIKKHYAGKGVRIVGISSDDDEDVWSAFIESKHMDWAEYIDLSGQVLQAFKIESFPTYMVLDKDGVVRYRQSGLSDRTQGEIEEALNKSLKRESNPALAAAASSAPPDAPVPAASGGSSAPADAKAPEATPTTPLSPVEVATVAGNVYKSEELDLS